MIIELAQNAADAAVRAGVPGRLRLSLREGVLTAANRGAPLDAAGVEALSTLRASDKRHEGDTAGRFGVGFAAVVAVSDEPAIGSVRPGPSITGVTWSADRTRGLAAGIPALADELAHRGGHVPLLRLPFPADPATLGGPHLFRDLAVRVDTNRKITEEDAGDGGGFDTVVRLPLRDAEAEALVRRQLEQVGPALMLALPVLESIEIEMDGARRVLNATHRRDGQGAEGAGTVMIDGVSWRTTELHGPIAPELLADRPTEERARPFWWLRWAVPATTSGLPGGVPAVIHGPTPSDEPLGLPALLIASFPLAPDRRHVAPGPLTDFLVEQAAQAYLRLLRDVEPTPRLLDLVPGPVAAGELDARIRRAVRAGLPDVPLLPYAEPVPDETGGAARLRGRDAVAVDGPPALIGLLAEVLPGLLPAGWPVRHPGLTGLGVRRPALADIVDALAGLDREPAWWYRLYDAFAGMDTDGLGALPVPLATADEGAGDGADAYAGAGGARTVRGPRGLLIAAEGLDPFELSLLGSRFVHPEAAHPLLLKLGAVDAGPREVLEDPAFRAAVAGSYEADDPEAVADAVLALVAAAHIDAGDVPWLAELALPDLDGELCPAGELLLPDGPLRGVVAPDSPFGVVDPELVARHGAEALEAVGVLRTFALMREEDVALTAPAFDRVLDLDGEEEWAADVLDRLPPHDLPPLIPELTAVRDLELVEDWDAALGLLHDRPLRAALTEPAQVLLGDGRRVAVPSYTAWWLRRMPVIGGRRPGDLCSRDADPLLLALYDPAPLDLEPDLSRALGVRTSLDELLAEPGGAGELLERLADPGRTVTRSQLRALWTALAVTDDAEPSDRVRAVVDGSIEVVPAGDALVLDSPDLLPLLSGQPLVIVPYELADRIAALLDLSLAGDELPGEVESAGEERPVPAVVREILPGAPLTYRHHDRLVVDGAEVPWRYARGVVHAADPTGGLARGLAWACGRWSDRLRAESALRDPDALPTLLAEADLD